MSAPTDLILDLAAHRSAFAYRGSLKPAGRYLYVGGSVATLLQIVLIGPLIGTAGGKKIRLLAFRQGAQHLAGTPRAALPGGKDRHGHRRPLSAK